jgi:hypothetical protein
MNEGCDIIFEGVLCHLFQYPLPGSIILNINEYELEHFYADEEILNLLERGRNQSWPLHYNDIMDLKSKISRELYKYIVIQSAYGFSGWVLAKNYSIRVNRI